jgi:hypothetical protein
MTPVSSTMDHGPVLRVLVVESKGYSLRWLSAKDEEMMFAPTVGL